jgi:hypothetical protein
MVKKTKTRPTRRSKRPVSVVSAAVTRPGGEVAAASNSAMRPKPLTGAMSAVDMARALNEWERRYIEAPKTFQADFRTVREFLAEEAAGVEPSYGQAGAAYMMQLLSEVSANAA